jgi:hypothetical protein
MIIFSKSRLTKLGTQTSPERRINLDLRPGQTLCMATIAFSGWGLWTWVNGDDALTTILLFYLRFFIFIFWDFLICCILFFFPFPHL